MSTVKTKVAIVLLLALIAVVSWSSWYKSTNPNAFVWSDEDKENDSWVATSAYWLDRRACRWLSICGLVHVRSAHTPFGYPLPEDSTLPSNRTDDMEWSSQWSNGSAPPKDEDMLQTNIPDFVFEYAPLVHLFSGEQFWPCDIAEHLYHTSPHLNYSMVQSELRNATLSTLDQLNQYENGTFVFLTSHDNVETRPEWLEGAKNIPEPVSTVSARMNYKNRRTLQPVKTHMRSRQGRRGAAAFPHKDFSNIINGDKIGTKNEPISDELRLALKEEAASLLKAELKRDSTLQSSNSHVQVMQGGRSTAPAILITVPKDDGVVDAFWFFFYSFNLGNTFFGVRYGNHIGDWEHTAIRFRNGTPEAVYLSSHSWGSAYTYGAIEKLGKRPVIYSARGTHAMYATPGIQPYILPFNLLSDETDRGPLWDPSLNFQSYTYNYTSEKLLASNHTPTAPVGWFHYAGHWGDKFYLLGDRRQWRLVGQYHYFNGPIGPKFKSLGRKQICGGSRSTQCVPEDSLNNIRGGKYDYDQSLLRRRRWL